MSRTHKSVSSDSLCEYSSVDPDQLASSLTTLEYVSSTAVIIGALRVM